MPGGHDADKPLNQQGIQANPEAEAFSLPRRFERLILLKLIARGGMGEVFLATSGAIEGAERACVVKIIRREHADDRSFLARFLDEARIQAQLQHPGIAQVLEAATDLSGKPYVVVEYIEGRNLGELRARSAQLGVHLAWPDAVAVAITLSEALTHVHERTDASGRPLEIVHRDLSPQNVMVGYGGDVKLIDFGTARGENRRCHTVAGIVFAKPGYVAPEVANNTPGAAPADVYALGIMLWELVAGRRFLTGEAAEHMAAVASGERHPAALHQLCDAPPELDALIGRLTATDPDRRCTAREATSELAQLLKRAPSLANGERSVRSRIAHLMQRLYPAEPARSRAEFARLVGAARDAVPELPARGSPPVMPPPSPIPGDTDPTLLAGTRYRLGREIGRGAVGIVYEAHHLDLGRTVALKVLNAECAPGSDLGQRFRSEARAIAQLDHENLVRLHDFGTAADGRPFYAMELLHGEALDRYLVREKGMDWREAMRVGIQACRALEAAHRAGVIHRDIKPGNLFLTRNGAVKLLDFGVAKRAAEVEKSDSQSSPGVMIVGTPEYMAPEQAAGGAADERSDIYALGVVLYELVTGRLPHVASSTVALLDAKLRKVPESPRDRAPQRGLPQMVDQTIQQALESDPNKRFQSASDMREALQAALREPELIRRRRRRIAFAALGVLTLALGGAIAAGASRPDVRARASAMAKPLIDRVSGNKPGASAEAVAAVAPVSQPAEGAIPGPAAPTSAGDPDEQSADPAAAAPESGEMQAAAEGTAATDPEAEEESDEQASADSADKGGDSADKGEQSDDGAGAPASGTANKPADDLDQKLAEAAEVMKNGRKVKGFNEIRRLGRKHMKDPRALKAWSEAAVMMHGWGEAHRVAQRWVKVDQSLEARLHLARMQRAVGKRDAAIKTLSLVLEQHPNSEEARGMLKSYQGTAVAMRR